MYKQYFLSDENLQLTLLYTAELWWTV